MRVRWRRGSGPRGCPSRCGTDDAPDDDGDVAASGDPGQLVRSEPLWVDHADAYELDLPPGVADAKVHLVREVSTAPAAGGPDRDLDRPAAAADGGGASPPPILLRAAWGARKEKDTPTIAPSLDLAVVHHTAVGGQSYLASDVPAILRGLQAFHMDANGWDDIAYNFVVDRFGRIWKARAGGISRAVQGGHAKGFNQRSVGVVVLGDFRTDAVSTATVTALGDLLGWKLFLHGVDPTAPVRRISADNPRFPEGTVVTLDAVAGHGDTGYTACPGDHLQARLGTIRSRAASIAATSRGSGTFAARCGLDGHRRGAAAGRLRRRRARRRLLVRPRVGRGPGLVRPGRRHLHLGDDVRDGHVHAVRRGLRPRRPQRPVLLRAGFGHRLDLVRRDLPASARPAPT